MKVLMMVSRLNIGGTEKHILSISRNLLAHGVRVGAVSHGGPLTGSFKNAGVTLHMLSSGERRKQISALSSIVLKGKYNLVHAHDSSSFSLAADLSRISRIPVIATVHGNYHHRASLLQVARVAKRIIKVSPNLANWLANYRIPATKIRMVPNGIDIKTFQPDMNKQKWRRALHLPLNAQIVVYAGRFSKDKYSVIRNLVLATQRLGHQNRNLLVVLIGPGSHRPDLIQLANNINRNLGRKAILIRSSMSNIQHAYYAADIVVGAGRVALEALACSKPIIAAGAAGYCGIVRPGNMDKMIRCHFGDHGAFARISTDRISNDIGFLCSHKKEALIWGKFGVQMVKMRFSLQTIGSRLLRIYSEVTNESMK